MAIRRVLLPLILVLLFLDAPSTDAQCSGGSWLPPVRAAVAVEGWVQSSEKHIYGWYVNGVQTGYYNSKTRIWRDYDAAKDSWGPPKRAPWVKEMCDCHCNCAKDECSCAKHGPCEDDCDCSPRAGVLIEQGIPNYGIDKEKINPDETTINGKKCSKRHAIDAITAGSQIPDDASWLRLTIVDKDASSLAALKAKMEPALKGVNASIQWYTKDNWAVMDWKLPPLPAVLVEEPEKPGDHGGKAVFAATVGNDPGPVIASVRKTIDSYDPSKVPGMPAKSTLPLVVAAVGALACVLIMTKK